MPNVNTANNQHSLIKSILMHILPGLLVTGAFILLKPLLDSIGYPPLLAFLLAVLLVDLPLLMGVMLFEGKKLNGHYSLNGVLDYREKIPWKTFAWVFIAAFVVAMGGFQILSENSAELRRMRVKKDLQDQGYGSQLLFELERLALQTGINIFTFETAKARPLTLEFYNKHGYQETGTGFYGNVETVHFRKELK